MVYDRRFCCNTPQDDLNRFVLHAEQSITGSGKLIGLGGRCLVDQGLIDVVFDNGSSQEAT